MATINLDTIIKAGLIMAFILPIMAIVSNTLPPPITVNGVNETAQMNGTASYIYNNFAASYFSTSNTLLGTNCGTPIPGTIPGGNVLGSPKNCSGSLYQSPTITQAFAFIINNLGTIISAVIQLPYLDYISLNMMVMGMSTVVVGIPLGFLSLGVDILYLYMGFSLLFMAIGLVQKYNMKVG